MADGPERGLVFVLDAQALTLVRFPDAGEPASIWTMPYDGAAMPANPGRVIVRSADQLFVADASLPGLRVISIETITAPVTVATYTSIDGPIHDLTLWGTRGSLAAPGPDTARYGGNTSCVEVLGTDGTILVLDAGTGIRLLGAAIPASVRLFDILLTHLHMDHIQGLGFFRPLYDAGVSVHIWGPASTTLHLRTRLMPDFRARERRGANGHEQTRGVVVRSSGSFAVVVLRRALQVVPTRRSLLKRFLGEGSAVGVP